MIGKMFGRLTVMDRGRSDAKHLFWVCRCRCRTVKEYRGDHLRAGLSRSCGCLHSEVSRARGNHYKAGKKFGRLTVVKELAGNPRRYFCHCRCGEYVSVRGRQLAENSTRSCGCLYRATRKSANLRHGKSPQGKKIAVYSCWTRQRSWCLNPADRSWKYYGSKGVRFLFASFPEFYAAVGDKPGNNYWLQRKNPDGHFEKENLEWREKGRRARKKGNPVRVALDPRALSTPAMPAATC